MTFMTKVRKVLYQNLNFFYKGKSLIYGKGGIFTIFEGEMENSKIAPENI